jgi:hypothetical protein
MSPARSARPCEVNASAPCNDVNCTRRNLCSRLALAKRCMLAHDRKQPRARRLAWGLDYDAARQVVRRLECAFRPDHA